MHASSGPLDGALLRLSRPRQEVEDHLCGPLLRLGLAQEEDRVQVSNKDGFLLMEAFVEKEARPLTSRGALILIALA